MAANAPWAPTQGATTQEDPGKPNGPAGAAGAAAAPVPSDAPQEIIDENDPRLISESLDANLEADAYAQPAPPPDGKYRAKLKLEGVRVEGGENKPYGTGQNKQKVPYFRTGVSCSIIDPSGKYDGITVYPAFGGGANTDRRRDGSTQVTTILTRITKPDGSLWAPKGAKMTQLEWIQLLVKALGTEPEIGIETAWEASCMSCAEELKKIAKYALRTTGMHHFPPETAGDKRKAGQLFQPEIRCQVNPGHGYARARAIVVSFLSLSQLK
jgi:hypothetical protein